MKEYKGYLPAFEYDPGIKAYCGWVSNTEPYPIATFVARQKHQLQQEFEFSVEIYLESCVEDGVEPLPPLPHPSQQENDDKSVSISDTEVIHQ